ncbi:universal stress protein [Paraburkholderia pallida]|uniref:Universal stress protein n=1 Tax=Paraburkholderia pallida TaxID=2547399 RepID=A0A4P7D5N5_9BURK|nr:universal stress protein [Paraburkholderia pallida]QBR04029.1 universal stress protein [Paraburkholderia pallida]HKU00840.1 universal stress protein [Paraburkholderia sp.]
MYRHLMVPVDGSDASSEIVGYAVEFARVLGARVTFLHVLGDSDLAARAGARVVEPGGLAWERLAKAEAAARAHGVSCDAVGHSVSPPYRAIFAASRECGCDLIVMAPRGKADEDGAPASQTTQVLAAAEQPVLVCAMEQRPAPKRVTGALLDEHRAHAGVLHAWLRVLRGARLQDVRPHLAPIRACAEYLRACPAGRQDGNITACLEERLRGRTHVIDAELGELALRRQRNKRMTRALSDLVERYAQGRAVASELVHAVSAYATFSWEYHGREEGVVYLAARRYLRDADWQAIDTMLSERARSRADVEYGRLIALINEKREAVGGGAHGAPSHDGLSAAATDPRT